MLRLVEFPHDVLEKIVENLPTRWIALFAISCVDFSYLLATDKLWCERDTIAFRCSSTAQSLALPLQNQSGSPREEYIRIANLCMRWKNTFLKNKFKVAAVFPTQRLWTNVVKIHPSESNEPSVIALASDGTITVNTARDGDVLVRRSVETSLQQGYCMTVEGEHAFAGGAFDDHISVVNLQRAHVEHESRTDLKSIVCISTSGQPNKLIVGGGSGSCLFDTRERKVVVKLTDTDTRCLSPLDQNTVLLGHTSQVQCVDLRFLRGSLSAYDGLQNPFTMSCGPSSRVAIGDVRGEIAHLNWQTAGKPKLLSRILMTDSVFSVVATPFGSVSATATGCILLAPYAFQDESALYGSEDVYHTIGSSTSLSEYYSNALDLEVEGPCEICIGQWTPTTPLHSVDVDFERGYLAFAGRQERIHLLSLPGMKSWRHRRKSV